MRHHAINDWAGPQQAPNLVATNATETTRDSGESKNIGQANPSTKEPAPKNYLRSLNPAHRERLGIGGRSLHDMRGTTPER